MRGCSVEIHPSGLRLRFRAHGRRVARSLGLTATAENVAAAKRLARLVASAVCAGRSLNEIDAILRRPAPAPASTRPDLEPTIAEFYRQWITTHTGLRLAQSRDYERHIAGYVLPRIGQLPIAELRPSDLRGLIADLSIGRSTKYVQNIVNASLRAMIRDARGDELLQRDPYAGIRWPRYSPPEPDPFTADDRDGILAWFAAQTFRVHSGGGRYHTQPWPPFAAFVDLLFWSGMRPSEATGLQWQDVDLAACTVQVRRSRHLGEYGEPKTRSARRTVELFPRLATALAALQPVGVAPGAPVFTHTAGGPLDAQHFTRHWYRCLRALKIRQRGLYATKDTFVTTAMSSADVSIRWLEQQTGEAYSTLRRHYGKWMPAQAGSELDKFRSVNGALFGATMAPGKKAGGKSRG